MTGTITVNETTREITVNVGSAAALNEAIAHANAWDGSGSPYTILFDASIDTVWLTLPLVITNSMTIDGGPLDNGSPSVDIQMDSSERIFEVDLELGESFFLKNVGVRSGYHRSPDDGTGGAGMLIEALITGKAILTLLAPLRQATVEGSCMRAGPSSSQTAPLRTTGLVLAGARSGRAPRPGNSISAARRSPTTPPAVQAVLFMR